MAVPQHEQTGPTGGTRRAGRFLIGLFLFGVSTVVNTGASTGLWSASSAEAQEPHKEAPSDSVQEAAVDPTSPAALRQALAKAPRRTKIGPMRSVRIHSDILFASDPDRPHELTFSAAFPKRSRLSLRPAGPAPGKAGQSGETLVSPAGLSERYQLGDAVFGRDVLASSPQSAARSYAQTGPAAAETKLDFALRRCAFFWPDEGSFQGAGWSRTTSVDELGVLLLRLDQDSGRPTEIRALGAEGQTVARLAAIEWQEIEGRAWPKSFEFWAGGSKIWAETVTGIESDWLLGDPWFLPSDRVGDVIGRKNSDRLRMRVRSASQVRSIPVVGSGDIDEAIGSALVHWRYQRAKLASKINKDQEDQTGWLLPSAALVLGADGKVVAVELEGAAPPTGTAPWPDWALRKATSEWAYLLEYGGGAKGKTGRPEEIRDARSLLEAPGTAAGKHGPIRLRIQLVESEVAGLVAGQRSLTRAAQEAPPGPPDHPSQRR